MEFEPCAPVIVQNWLPTNLWSQLGLKMYLNQSNPVQSNRYTSDYPMNLCGTMSDHQGAVLLFIRNRPLSYNTSFFSDVPGYSHTKLRSLTSTTVFFSWFLSRVFPPYFLFYTTNVLTDCTDKITSRSSRSVSYKDGRLKLNYEQNTKNSKSTKGLWETIGAWWTGMTMTVVIV